MNRNEDLFEDFLKGRLTQDERHAFETRVREEADFAREFEIFRSLYDLVNRAGEQRLKEKLAAIHREITTSGTSRDRPAVIPMRPLGWLAIAASILLAIGATWFLMGRSTDPQQLYAAHMAPYAGPDRARSGDVGSADHWLRFAVLYDAARYDEALVELDSVVPGRAPDYLISFYRGQCLLLRKDPDPRSAMRALEAVLASDNDLHAIARWYLGLAALKAGDVTVARTHLGALRQAGGFKSTEAARILEALGDP